MTTDGNAPMTTDGNAPMTAAARTNAAAPLDGRPPLGATRGLSSGEAPTASGERGNILVLGTAMWLAAVVALAVVVNVTSLYIQRRAILSAADAIALGGAQEVDESAYYGGAGEKQVVERTPRIMITMDIGTFGKIFLPMRIRISALIPIARESKLIERAARKI